MADGEKVKKDFQNAQGTTSLNFKVSPEFKKDFKGYAVAQGISMTDLLKQCFSLSQQKQKK